MKKKLCDDCKWRKQSPTCVKCSHPNKNMTNTKNYIGRGHYVYWGGVYSECDCNGWKK